MNQKTQAESNSPTDIDGNTQPTYPILVASLFKTGEATIKDIVDKVSPQAVALFHATVGLVGEAIEYQSSSDEKNIREELADSIFFAEAAKQIILPNHPTFPFPQLDPRPGVALYTDAVDALLETANGLMDFSKKEVIYAKTLTPEQIFNRQSLFSAYYAALSVILDFHGYTGDQLKAENVDKLTKRYAKGYSNEAAAERADKKEGEA